MTASARPLRVALVDDQPRVRAGLRVLLERLGIEIAFEAEDGQDLLDALQLQVVDVILSGMRMPGMDGIAALRELRARGDRTPVLLLTAFDDSELSLQASAVGAQGFLLKDAPAKDLHDAVVRVAAGETLLPPIGTDPVRARYRLHDDAPPDSILSEREVAILRLLADGYSNKEVARSLFLAEGTVKNHVSAILDKLGTRDHTRAVIKAITLRII